MSFFKHRLKKNVIAGKRRELLISQGRVCNPKGWALNFCNGNNTVRFPGPESAHNEGRMEEAQGDESVLVGKQRHAFLQSASASERSHYFISAGFNWQWWEERRCWSNSGRANRIMYKFAYSSICCIKSEGLFSRSPSQNKGEPSFARRSHRGSLAHSLTHSLIISLLPFIPSLQLF